MSESLFVARDRARRIAWNLERVLQERRLAWRGAEIGMASVKDDADTALGEIAEDARRSTAAVLAGEIRDRERGFMEIPFAVALTTVVRRIERAADLEARRRVRQVVEQEARRRVVEELSAALARLEIFQAAYDDKTPLPEPRSTDVAHVLSRLAPGSGRPWDRPPPPLVTDAAGLEDLLLAMLVALPDAEGGWHVTPSGPGHPLELALGRTDVEEGVVDVPPEVERAADVLGFLHPVEVVTRAIGRSDGSPALAGLVARLGDPAGRNLDATVAIVAGGEARLSAEARRAVEALLAAPSVADGAPVPPARLVALVGLLQVFDSEVSDVLLPRFQTPDVRLAAADLPREKTRKAPIRRAFCADLERTFAGLETSKLSDLATAVAGGRIGRPPLPPVTAALLLAVFGRDTAAGGARLRRVVDLAPLGDEDVAAMVEDLVDVARIRRAFESGREVAPQDLTRWECAVIAVLARLGRVREGP